MQTRRQAVSPLSLILPHPQLLYNRTSLLAPASSPRTPRSRAAPPLPLFSPSNRKSSDSWNSSTHDDEVEWEWRQEETLLLQRTLDNLPAHLLTPFNGPVPPSNLLDKIARAVAHAKGPGEWPHSLRATRAKIAELTRIRAKESLNIEITAEDQCDDRPRDILCPTSRTNRKRPLYRQSSMDFILEVDPNIKTSIKDNQSINRLSQRLQRTDRILLHDTYHPYSRPNSPSPRKKLGTKDSYSPLFSPSTPSSSTLNSSSSFSSTSRKAPVLRRSISSLSSSSDAYSAHPLNPVVQRLKRADSFATPIVYGRGQSLKRAPSFGAASTKSSESNTMSVDESLSNEKEAGSSDEEEKLRSKKAKRARRKSPLVSPSPLPGEKALKPVHKVLSTHPSEIPAKPPSLFQAELHRDTPKTNDSNPQKKTAKLRANLRRNPSILGGELPNPQPHLSPVSYGMSIGSDKSVPKSPEPPCKSLRRVKATSFARPLARRISFSSLATPQEEDVESHGAGMGLGSAFQLH